MDAQAQPIDLSRAWRFSYNYIIHSFMRKLMCNINKNPSENIEVLNIKTNI